MRLCINRFARKLQEKDNGIAPFIYGKMEDYWPEIDMAPEYVFPVSKSMYLSTRSEKS